MKSKQSGFTLIEIAIVLVIIGLLLGGVLKGQELINSAKVKNFANDFRNIPLFIYGYQDKFKSLPGDDAAVISAHLGTAVGGVTVVLATTPASPAARGNGVIEGAWNSSVETDESILFWQHARLAGLAAGPTTAPSSSNILDFLPKNADGGFIGITSGSSAASPVTGLTGTYVVCSTSILGKYAKQLDVTLDDGNTSTGSLRAITNVTALAATTTPAAAIASSAIDDATSYTMCMSL
jgi:prepilin-type N-terminal cleavage/methylation domain-containing protein